MKPSFRTSLDELQHVEALYAWVVTNEDGSQGIVGFASQGAWMPMISSQRHVLEKMRDLATLVAREGGSARLELVSFGARVTLETVTP